MTPSDISFKFDGDEISDRVVFARSYFESQANPIAGKFDITVKDPDQTFTPVAGKKMTGHIDGVPLFGGYAMRIARTHFFDAVDTTAPASVKTRAWRISGPDFNVLFDKRVVYDPDAFDRALRVPAGKRTISKAMKFFLNHYIDLPNGLDVSSKIDVIDTGYGDETHGGLYVEQGKYWRDQMEDFADNGGIIYYIDADFALNAHEYEEGVVSWVFVDSHPDGVRTIGFREGEYAEDSMPIVTDALVWGGSALAKPGEDIETSEGVGVVFARYPDPPANDATWFGREQSKEREQGAIDRQEEFGRWQAAEMNVGQENYLTKGSVKNRAFVIINGPPGRVPTKGIEGGFSRPIQTMSATWFAHDVPSSEHLRPGDIADFILYTQGKDAQHPLVTSLPLRSMKVSFPTLPGDNPSHAPKTYVRFDGDFGTSYSDSRHLWRFLKNRGTSKSQARRISAIVDNTTADIANSSQARFHPIETPDGVTESFTFPAVFHGDSMDVYLNGLFQRPGLDYSWDAEAQSLRFSTILSGPSEGDLGDRLWVTGIVSE